MVSEKVCVFSGKVRVVSEKVCMIQRECSKKCVILSKAWMYFVCKQQTTEISPHLSMKNLKYVKNPLDLSGGIV